MLDLLIRNGQVVTPQGVARWTVGISGEPTIVRPERNRTSLLDLLMGDVSPWLPTKEKLMDQQIGFYYLWK